MSNADRVSLAYAVESTYGTIPSPAAALQGIRFVSEGLKEDLAAAESTEIRSDRQLTEVFRSNITASGDISFEFSYGSFDDLLKWALQCSAWSSVVANVISNTNVSASSVTNKLTVAGGGVDFDAYTVGAWVEVRGFTETANNGYFKITAKAVDGTDITLAGGTLVTEIAGDAVTVTQGAYITNGTTGYSFYVEKGFADITQFAQYVGCVIDGMSMTFTPGALVTGSFSLVAKSETSAAVTAGSSTLAVNTNKVFNVADDAIGLLEGATPATFQATQLSFSLANNSRPWQVIGSLGPIGYGTGLCKVTGTLQAYLANATTINKFLNMTRTAISIVLEDDAGNAYVIEFPSVKFTSGARVAGGQSSDVLVDLAFTAYRDTTDGITMRIVRFAASFAMMIGAAAAVAATAAGSFVTTGP